MDIQVTQRHTLVCVLCLLLMDLGNGFNHCRNRGRLFGHFVLNKAAQTQTWRKRVIDYRSIQNLHQLKIVSSYDMLNNFSKTINLFLRAKRLQKIESKLGFDSQSLFMIAKIAQYFYSFKPIKVIIIVTYQVANIEGNDHLGWQLETVPKAFVQLRNSNMF